MNSSSYRFHIADLAETSLRGEEIHSSRDDRYLGVFNKINKMRILQLNLFRTCSVRELFEPPGPVPDINVNNQLPLAWA
jgi:hypothetical protein